LEKNKVEGHFVGNDLTLADFFVFAFLGFVESYDVLKNFPRLDTFNNKMKSRPRLAAWIAKRPKTTM